MKSKQFFLFNTRERGRNRCREQDWEQYVQINCTEMFTLVQNMKRNQNPLFPMVLVQFPVPVSVPFRYNVNVTHYNASDFVEVRSHERQRLSQQLFHFDAKSIS